MPYSKYKIVDLRKYNAPIYYTKKDINKLRKKGLLDKIQYDDNNDTPIYNSTKDMNLRWGYNNKDAEKEALFAVNNSLSHDASHIDGGILPEIIVKPSKYDKLQLRNIKRIFRDKQLRNSFYDDDIYDIDSDLKLSQNDKINNLTELYIKSGKPTIHKNPLIPFFNYPDGTPRPHYNAANNNMYNINDYPDFVAELSHAYQYYAPNRRNLNTIGIPGDIKLKLQNNRKDLFHSKYDGYDRAGHFEHSAHSIIEPAMWDYINYGTDASLNAKNFNDIITDYLIDDKNNEDKVNENIKQSDIGTYKDRRFTMDKNNNPIWTSTFKYGGLTTPKRRKCWIGAAIGAATSIAGSIMNGISQNNQLKQQRAADNTKSAYEFVNNLNNMLNSDSIDDQYREKMIFKYGGCRNKANFGCNVRRSRIRR